MHYYPLVKEMLKDVAEVVEIPENCDHTKKTKKKLKKWLKGLDGSTLSLVHFNNGVHDISRYVKKKSNQVPLPKYIQNLQKIIGILRTQTPATLIWATSTPIIEERHFNIEKGKLASLERIQAYNREAILLMKSEQIPINDLNSVIIDGGIDSCMSEDGIHMAEKGNKLLADAVARTLQKYL